MIFPGQRHGRSEYTWTDGRVALAVFLATLFVYIADTAPAAPTSDSVPNACLPASILGDGDLAFSPFEAPFMFLWSTTGENGAKMRVEVDSWNRIPPGSGKSYAQQYNEGLLNFDGPLYFLVPTIREKAGTGEPQFVGVFGPVAGLSAVPFAVLARLVGVDFQNSPPILWSLARLTAASLVAGSAALLYLTAVGFTSRPRALLLAAAYGAGTCVWSISSQSLWQQTPEIFFLSLGVFCLLRVPVAWIRGVSAGVALSAAAACRPTAAMVVAAVAVGLALWDRRALLSFIPALIPFAAATAAYNIYYFDSPLDFGQLEAGARVAQYKTGSPDLWQTPLWLGAAGLLFSPSRGLLVFSPFLVAAFAGAALVWRDPRYHALRFLTLAVPALWIPAFLWFDWWGGWTYGYRPIVDSLPLLVPLCLPTLEWILVRPAWRATFAVLLVWSVFVQALGTFAYNLRGWNAKIVDSEGTQADIDQRPYRYRLWSLSDSQIGYLIAHFRQARDERKPRTFN